MLHSVDAANPASIAPLSRKEWMSLLARGPLALLENALADDAGQEVVWLRPPEIGLYMVRGRVGGSGAQFNVGEVTVTRCALRLRQNTPYTAGVAHVMGRSHRHAHLAALADAMLQDAHHYARLHAGVLMPLSAALAGVREAQQQKAAATRVEFFTVARQRSAADGAESDAA
jgi:alpha-D-ribose 1-methylphosphonate 5-triphosphate synthase subunit PhnG